MSNLPSSTDILVVGAGPSGLALAGELRRLGGNVVCLDRQAAGANTSRAAVVHARTLEVLEPLGIVPGIVADGVKVPVFRLRDRDRMLMEVQFANLETPYPFTLMYPQNRMEATLLARLESLGGSVVRPVEMTALHPNNGGVDVDVRSGDVEQRIRAKWVIGCDGAHSVVRRDAGISFEGGEYTESFVLADVRMHWPISREEVSLFFSPAGLVVIAPLPDDHFRIVATIDQAPEQPDAAFMQDIIVKRGPTTAPFDIYEMVWSSRFHIQHKVASIFYQDRVLLCGDAAHVHSPAGGQGMNTGIQDAIALAEPLLEANRSGETAGLDAWSARRHEIASGVVALTDRMTRAATLKAGTARAVRNAAIGIVGHLPGVSERLARQLAELDNR